jgi:hypothetical protein
MKNMGALAVLVTVALMITGCGGSGSSTPATLSLSQSNLTLTTPFGGPNPAAASVNVSVTGSDMMKSFTATSDSPWLSVTPASGTAPDAIQISAGLGTLTSASYTGHITVIALGVQGSPATITVTFVVAGPVPSNAPFWAQWGANPQHTGMVAAAGQKAAHMLADIIYDKFVPQEEAEAAAVVGEPALLVHYQAPLIDGNDVYMMTRSGTYTSCNPPGAWANGQACGPNAWNTMIWNESRFSWENGQLIHIWDFQSDWKPEPDSLNQSGIGALEPVFHAAEANGFLYVPGVSGTIWKVNKTDGTAAKQINPFTSTGNVAKNTYVFSPLTADSQGNIYYNVIELADSSLGDPWLNDAVNSWLVKVTPQDAPSIVTYATLTPSALAADAMCEAPYFFAFDPAVTLPWPPAGFPPAATRRCGPQRSGGNVAPAIAPDGTIYTASRAHTEGAEESFLIAVNPDLTLKWAAPMQHILNDGCGVVVPINDSSNSNVNFCRFGTKVGVDPNTNAKGSPGIPDAGTSSPTVLPDGSVVFGAGSNYNAGRGHLLHFDKQGNYLNEFDFGWDSTPAVFARKDGTFSVIIKDNHYPVPFYCGGNPGCQNVPAVYYISQLNPNKPDPAVPGKMLTEWSFQSTNTMSCMANPTGPPTCVSDHPNGFEWCINMPGVDANGNVYVTSEDGNVYVLPQGNSGVFTAATGNLFLNLALGAAYTPLAIGPDGKIYTQNNGHLFVVGN